MSDVTRLLNAMEQGDSQAATALLPLVYDELRRLAGHKMANEAAGHTLQPTALVHEAWLRLVGDDASAEFVNRAHFFAAAAELLARLIAHDLRTNPRLVLGLATGRTMESVYDRLARMHLEDGLSFAGARSFNLDEYVGLPASDPHSYRHYMDEHLFNKVNVDLCNTHLPDGTAGDLDKECAAYEALMVKCGGIDLQLLGIGQTGHIGFNEPLSALRSRTRVKALSPVTVAQNASLFADPSKMPRRAITMGVGTILDSPPRRAAGHRRGQGGDYRQGRRRPHHLDDFRHRAPDARALHGYRGRSRRREAARRGLLPLDFRERAGVGTVSRLKCLDDRWRVSPDNFTIPSHQLS